MTPSPNPQFERINRRRRARLRRLWRGSLERQLLRQVPGFTRRRLRVQLRRIGRAWVLAIRRTHSPES